MISFLTAAVVVLLVLVVVLFVLVLGVLRRLLPALQRAEDLLRSQPGSVIRHGLEAGRQVPDFTVVDVAGRETTSAELLAGAEHSVLLLLEPGCEPCEHLLAQLSAEGAAAMAVPLVVALPASAESRAAVTGVVHGAQVVFQRDLAVSNALDTAISPQAFLLRRDGVVMGNTIPGSLTEIEELISHVPSKGLIHISRRSGDGASIKPS